MSGLRKQLLTGVLGAGVMIGLGLTATPTLAAPTVDAFYSLNGGTTWLDIGGTCPNLAGTFCTNAPTVVGNFTLQMSVNSNAPGTLTQSNATNASVQLKNNSTSTQTILLLGGGTDFTQPLGNFLWDATSGTTTIGSGGSVSTIACLRYDNTLSGSVGCSGADFVTPTESFSPLPNAAAWALTTGITPTGPLTPGNYALLDFLSITLTAGEQITFSSSAQEVTAFVPEPTSLAILGSALLGFGLIRRRRNT